MARLLKPLLVEERFGSQDRLDVYDLTASIYYDRNTHTHFATIDGLEDEPEVRAETIGEVKTKLVERFKGLTTVTWQPVIEATVVQSLDVTYRDRAARWGFVSLNCDRYHVGTMGNGNLYELSWHYHGAELGLGHLRNATKFGWYGEGAFAVPCSYAQGKTNASDKAARIHHYLPYSEELWLGLEVLGEQIIALRQAIAALVGTGDGVARLTQVGATVAPLLPPRVDHFDQSPYATGAVDLRGVNWGQLLLGGGDGAEG